MDDPIIILPRNQGRKPAWQGAAKYAAAGDMPTGFFSEEITGNHRLDPVQGTPNLRAVVASPRGTLAPTSRQGASARTTGRRPFVLKQKTGGPGASNGFGGEIFIDLFQ